MRSSTFSFDRAPISRWRTTLVIAVVTAIVIFVAIELFWRYQGATENYIDDPRRWSFLRDKVEALTEPNATVLVGASRIQLAWSLDTFRSMVAETPIIQLAIDGAGPFAILRDISENTGFRGVLIVALTAGSISPASSFAAESHVQFYTDSWTPNIKLNFLIDDFLQGHLISRQPAYGLAPNIRLLLRGNSLPHGPNYLKTTRERERNADYRLLDISRHRAERIRRIRVGAAQFQAPTPEIWDESIRALDGIVRPMSQRGTRVVFIRFPTSGEHWELDEEKFPRDQYWNDMANRVSGLWVHFQDIPGINRIGLPDTSHIDKRDKAEFTRLIISKLRELSVY